MAVGILTPTSYTQVSAQYYPQAVLLPSNLSPTAALIQCIGPQPAVILLGTAVATTTGTVAAGATAMTVASGTSIAVGQLIVGIGIASGTYVAAVTGTAVKLSQPAAAALSGATVNFVGAVTNATGIVVLPNTALPLLGIGSNTYLSYICQSGGYAGGASSVAVLNIATGTVA